MYSDTHTLKILHNYIYDMHVLRVYKTDIHAHTH